VTPIGSGGIINLAWLAEDAGIAGLIHIWSTTMDELTRRGMVSRAMGTGLVAILPASGAVNVADPDEVADNKLDRDCVIASGMTEAEADCWVATAKAAKLFFDLPELHPTDKQDIADAIHVIQLRLLSRPTYRKYKESHKTLGHNNNK
jgi:hypothetical protein